MGNAALLSRPLLLRAPSLTPWRMCCEVAGAYARGVWLLQAGAGRRQQRQEQRRQRQLGGGGDGGNGSVGDDGATGGSVQGRGGGVPLREEADSPLHRRHPHGERAGPGWARCSPGSCFPSSPSPRPSAAHWRKSVLQLLGEAAFSPTGPTNSPLQGAPRSPWRAPSPVPRTHFDVLASGLPPFQNPGPLLLPWRRCFA